MVLVPARLFTTGLLADCFAMKEYEKASFFLDCSDAFPQTADAAEADAVAEMASGVAVVSEIVLHATVVPLVACKTALVIPAAFAAAADALISMTDDGTLADTMAARTGTGGETRVLLLLPLISEPCSVRACMPLLTAAATLPSPLTEVDT